MVWFVCKMHLRHICTFASENLTVKGLNCWSSVIIEQWDNQKINSKIFAIPILTAI